MYCVIINTDNGLRIGIDEQPIGTVISKGNEVYVNAQCNLYSSLLQIPVFSESDIFLPSDNMEVSLKCIDASGYVFNDESIEVPAYNFIKRNKVYTGIIVTNELFEITDESGQIAQYDLFRFQYAGE